MSTKRLNIDEKARYLIGEAVMRRIHKSERDPATTADIRTLCNWIERWLTDDELDEVSIGTGLIFDEELAKELQGDIMPDDGTEDDVPF